MNVDTAEVAYSRGTVEIDAGGLHHAKLNGEIFRAVEAGAQKVILRNVHGQRYIGTGIAGSAEIEVFGTPGNDMGAFMDGTRIVVNGNVQDGTANTMNSGEIVIKGHAGDLLGMAMRGGKVFVRDDVGYRACIHMKEYGDAVPVVVVGGCSQDFFGEYMAGGRAVVLGLGLDGEKVHRAMHIGTGMHGGVIYIRESVEPRRLGKDVVVQPIDAADRGFLDSHVRRYASLFDRDAGEILSGEFTKLVPVSSRPYGRLYAY